MVQDLLREGLVGRRPGALRSVGQDGLVARVGLFELDGSRDLRLEDEAAEQAAELLLEVPMDVVLLHHREEDAADPEGSVVQEPPDLGHVLLELAQTQDAEEAGAEGDEDLLDAVEDVRRENGPRGGRVHEDEIISLVHALEGHAEPPLSPDFGGQDHGGVRQAVVRREEVHALEVRGGNRLVRLRLGREDLEERGPAGLLASKEDVGAIALWVRVYHEDALVLLRQTGRHVQDGRGFPHSALLADEANGPHGRFPPVPRGSDVGSWALRDSGIGGPWAWGASSAWTLETPIPEAFDLLGLRSLELLIPGAFRSLGLLISWAFDPWSS